MPPLCQQRSILEWQFAVLTVIAVMLLTTPLMSLDADTNSIT